MTSGKKKSVSFGQLQTTQSMQFSEPPPKSLDVFGTAEIQRIDPKKHHNDELVHVPSLTVLMNLVSEVRQALKTFKQTDDRMLIFDDKLTELNHRVNTKLTSTSLEIEWRKFSQQMTEWVEHQLEVHARTGADSETIAK